ncbi:MAG: bacterioferritin-associated ferredoxin [Reyranellaceae bacterium]
MFVCLCNGFTERQVRECLRADAQSVAGVYRCLGKPQCGKCIGHVREMVETARTETRQHACGDDRLPVAAAAVPA